MKLLWQILLKMWHDRKDDAECFNKFSSVNEKETIRKSNPVWESNLVYLISMTSIWSNPSQELHDLSTWNLLHRWSPNPTPSPDKLACFKFQEKTDHLGIKPKASKSLQVARGFNPHRVLSFVTGLQKYKAAGRGIRVICPKFYKIAPLKNNCQWQNIHKARGLLLVEFVQNSHCNF